MRRLLLAAALAAAGSTVAKSDELADLKAQLEAANKSIQALQGRVRALEDQKVQRAATQPAQTARAAALPVKTSPPPLSLEPPVIAPNEKPVEHVTGPEKRRVELYGAAQLDAIYDAKKMDPDRKS